MDVRKKLTRVFGPDSSGDYVVGFITGLHSSAYVDSGGEGGLNAHSVDRDRLVDAIMRDDTLRERIEDLAFSVLDNVTTTIIARLRLEMREYGDDSAITFGIEVASSITGFGPHIERIGPFCARLGHVIDNSDAARAMSFCGGLTIDVDTTRPFDDGTLPIVAVELH